MADGQADLEPEESSTIDEQLLSLLNAPAEAEVSEEEPEETQAKAEPETEDSGDDEAHVDAEEHEAEAPKTWKVKVDGAEVEVTEDELLRGYSRQQDYTRKTMDLAEKRKAQEAEATQIRVERAEYAGRLEQMKAFLDRQMGDEPDWEALKASDPAGYAVKFADYQRQQSARDRVVTEQARVRQREIEEQQGQLQQRIAAEKELLFAALPDWKNHDVAEKEQRALMDYGKGLGFSEDELGNLYDHRAVLILDKARRFDELQKKGSAVKEKAKESPVLKPGTTKQKPPKDTADKLKERFMKSRNEKDAVSLIEHLLTAG